VNGLGGGDGAGINETSLKLPTIRRFPRYLKLLHELNSSGRDIVSSAKIADELKLDPIVVRKDLAFTGVAGKPKLGFSIPHLIEEIEKVIYTEGTVTYLIGAGELGSALIGYSGLDRFGFRINAVFDIDPGRVNTIIQNRHVFKLEQLPEMIVPGHTFIAILCVPDESAQNTADLLIKAGISAIWNFTNTELHVPENVTVQNESLAAGLAELSVKLRKKAGTAKLQGDE
jgi:redox-sensing transcriptional repressor